MVNRLYKNIKEAFQYAPDSIASAVKYILGVYNAFITEDIATEFYSAILSYMILGDLYDKSLFSNPPKDRVEIEKFYSKNSEAEMIMFLLPRTYNQKEEVIVLSSVLHAIHKDFPDAHANAVKRVAGLKKDVAKIKGHNLSLEKEVCLHQPDFLTGKDDVPTYIKKFIAYKLKYLGADVAWDASVTWHFSHLDCGCEYNYSCSEAIRVTITAIDEQTVNSAVKTLESVTADEIASFKKL